MESSKAAVGSGRHSRFVLGLLVGIALLFGVARFVNLAETLEEFREYPWPRLAPVIGLSLLYYLLKAIRWHYLLSIINIRLPLRRSLLIYLAGQWFAITPAGEFVRAYLLTGYGYRLAHASAAVAAQVVLDLLSLAIVASVAVIWYGQFAAIVLPFTIALLAGIIVFSYAPEVLRIIRRRPPTTAQTSFAGWSSLLVHSRRLFGWRPMIIGSALAIPAVLAGSGVLFMIATGFDISETFEQAAYIYSLSQLVGALSMLPHGLGAIEASSVALFHYAGADTAHAASTIALFRLCTLVWGLIIGALSLLALRSPLAGPDGAHLE